MSVSHHPPVLWAQRKDKLFVTIDVQDCKHPKLKLDKLSEDSEVTVLTFSCVVADGSSVDLRLELNAAVDPQQAKVSVTGRHVLMVIPKNSDTFWPRLTKDKPPRFVSVDWSKWVDEDEEDEAPEFDMNSLGNLGGLEQFDSDDDDGGEDEDDAGDEDEAEVTEDASSAPVDAPKGAETEATESQAEVNGTSAV